MENCLSHCLVKEFFVLNRFVHYFGRILHLSR